MSDFCRILDVPSILTKIVPCFADLQKDTFVYVRCALAENILSLCPALGKANTNQHILPLFLVLLRDESSEVRLNLFKHLEDLNQVIGITELQ
jgi:serine/threonine-protein phosphatase 2A regulatory subunit A